jgi:ParB family chromosome partitioning protein
MTATSRLGRGLGSLIPSVGSKNTPAATTDHRVHHVPLSELRTNPRQPRTSIERGSLDDLITSIRQHGILQPLVVTPGKSGGYELIAGERRFQAAKILGLATIPVIIRKATEQQQLELALVENLQRRDLNPMEEAAAYQKLIDEFNLTQERIAQRVGKSRSHIANTLRLLNLPPEVKNAILEAKITEGHAKVLLSLDTPAEQRALLERIIAHGLSVRAGEALVGSRRKSQKRRATHVDPNLRAYEDALQRALGTKVSIERRGSRGTIRIEFYSREELTALLTQLTQRTS